jgi:two-component system, LuxR family, response regulator FixJ
VGFVRRIFTFFHWRRALAVSIRSVVHVIDDDDDVRDSVRLSLMTAGFDARTYASATDFLAKMSPNESGCVVTDVRMPGMSGIDFLAHMAARRLALPIIVITAHADVPLAVQAMKLGAVDLIEKPFRSDELISIVRNALDRERDDVSRDGARAEFQARLAALSPRETEVLSRLVDGRSNKVIAQELGISPRTVEVHRANVMRKTKAANFSELIRTYLGAERT